MNGILGRLAVLSLVAVAAAGCGQGLPPQTDVKQARAALDAALDAWKGGKSAESLRGREPPVDFSDPAWEKGTRLAKYEVEKEETFGLSARFTVKLYLGERAGQNPRRVVYTADAGETVVIRPDF
jgi:hypothetical protein